ncbi:MAG: hypothetical protein ACRC30_05005 [Clostridium sp.]
MAGANLDISLTKENTVITSIPVFYNIEILIDLKDYKDYMEDTSSRIYVETNLEIPVVINGEKKVSIISLINHYNINEILDDKVIQYGYYEGVYDEERSLKKNSNIFIYKIK